jgi:LysR family transcriptional regulator, glycine cleavage system transcriptional activator
MTDRPHLPPFAALRAFEAFGRHGRVRRTAVALGVSHAIVSRHLAALEDWLGTMLVDRVHGGLTPAGADYHALISPAFDQLCSATERMRGDTGSRLQIWSMPGLAYHWLTSRLPDFGRRHPGLAVTLRPSDAPPDLSRHEAHADLRWRRDVDLAGSEHPTITRVAMIRPRIFPVAHPDAPWLAGQRVEQASDLLALPLLHEDDDVEWQMWFAAHGVTTALPPPAARLWQGHMTLVAAREGQGVALTNGFLAGDDLAAGRVVDLSAGHPAFRPVSLGAYYLTTHAGSGQTRPLRQFSAWLADMVRQAPGDWQAPVP